MNHTIFFRRVTTLSLLGGIWLTLASCDQGPSRSFNVNVRTPVEVQAVRLGDIENLVVTTGNLLPRVVATVNARVPGRLYHERDENGERFYEGHQVKKGDVLARIAGEEVELHLNLSTKKQTYEIAEAEYNRQKKLHEEGIITESAFEQSLQSYLNAENAYKLALQDDRNTVIEAPIDGVIVKLARNEQNTLLADESLIGNGQLVAEIADLSMLEAHIDLIGRQYGKVDVGDQARIRPSATYEEINFTGTVTRKSPLVNPEKHTYQVVLEVPNNDLLLNPLSFVEVEVIIEQRLQVPVVSLDSVKKSSNNNDVVYIVEGQRLAERRVRLGLQDDERVEVLEGLEVGERVVFGGVENLWPGTMVNVVREQ